MVSRSVHIHLYLGIGIKCLFIKTEQRVEAEVSGAPRVVFFGAQIDMYAAILSLDDFIGPHA